MGNVLEKPKYFSVDDPQRIDNRYLQTYRQRPISRTDPDDAVPLGQSRVQLGVKVLQSMNTGQLYTMDPAGHPVVLSEGNPPRFLPNAAELVTRGANYGRGPAVFITGSPLGPKVTMFSSSDMTASRAYEPIRINNLQDFQFAMETGHSETDWQNPYANYRGQAAINPFLERGSDFESGLADAGRFVVHGFAKLWSKVPEMIMDEVLPMSGTLIGGLTGATDALGAAADRAATALTTPALTERTYVSGDYDPGMANIIRDPRLEPYFDTIQKQSEAFPDALNFAEFPQETHQQMITKGRLLSKENAEQFLRQETKTVSDTMLKVNRRFANSQDANLRELTNGLRNAPDNASKLRVIQFFQKRLKTDVLPYVSSDDELAPLLNHDVRGTVDIDPISSRMVDLTNSPLVINGDFVPGDVGDSFAG